MSDYSKLKPRQEDPHFYDRYGEVGFGQSSKVREYTKEIHSLLDQGLHPDGQPWKKCCCGDDRLVPEWPVLNCAFIDKRMTKKSTNEKYPFVCGHQTADGYFRVCAGWHACFGEKKNEVA